MFNSMEKLMEEGKIEEHVQKSGQEDRPPPPLNLHPEARRRLHCLFAQNDIAVAQFNLALMFEKGLGGTQDDAQAVEWFRKAAKQGHAGAQHNLGDMYKQGRGDAQDDARAELWYRRGRRAGLMPRLKPVSGSCTC